MYSKSSILLLFFDLDNLLHFIKNCIFSFDFFHLQRELKIDDAVIKNINFFIKNIVHNFTMVPKACLFNVHINIRQSMQLN